MSRIVFCPDSFKGSTTATGAAGALAAGWSRVRRDDEVVVLGQADGGEGTTEVVAAAAGEGDWHEVPATGPDGGPTLGRWHQVGDAAVCDLAQVVGLPMMARPEPYRASTRGLGQVIAAALAAGARSVHVGLGGSASTDGGAGALAALGWQLLDAAGTPVPDGGGGLAAIRTVRPPEPRPEAEVVLVTDVTAPLLGPGGAAAVFGPQKGAGPDDIPVLERGLAHWADLLGGPTDRPGMGAAGGVGYGLARGLGAEIVDGAAWVSRRTGLDAAVAGADLVVTGEGRFDRTSLEGKVVGHVLGLARAAGVPCRIVAGQSEDLPGPTVITLTELAGSPEGPLADPQRWLARAGELLARRWTPGSGS